MTEAVQEKLHADTIDHYEEEHAERDFENADPDRRLQIVGDNRIVRRGYVWFRFPLNLLCGMRGPAEHFPRTNKAKVCVWNKMYEFARYLDWEIGSRRGEGRVRERGGLRDGRGGTNCQCRLIVRWVVEVLAGLRGRHERMMHVNHWGRANARLGEARQNLSAELAVICFRACEVKGESKERKREKCGIYCKKN